MISIRNALATILGGIGLAVPLVSLSPVTPKKKQAKKGRKMAPTHLARSVVESQLYRAFEQHYNPAANAKRKLKREIGARQLRMDTRHGYKLKAEA